MFPFVNVPLSEKPLYCPTWSLKKALKRIGIPKKGLKSTVKETFPYMFPFKRPKTRIGIPEKGP